MRRLFPSLLLIWALACGAVYGNPFDFGRFLEAWDLFLLVGNNRLPLAVEGFQGEHYAYMDPNGNQYVLIPVPNQREFLDHLLTTQLATVLGMPHSPSWPTVIQRGRAPVIRREGSQLLFPGQVQTILGDEPWIPAVILPLWDKKRVPGYTGRETLNPRQLADLNNFLVFSYLFGLQIVPQPFITPERLVAGGLASPFASYRDGKPNHGTFRNFIRAVNTRTPGAYPVEALRQLAADESKRLAFVASVNGFLSRLETLAETEMLSKLAGLSYRITESGNPARMLDNIRKILLGARSEVFTNLSSIDSRFKAPERIKRDFNPYYVDFQRYSVRWADPTPPLGKDWKFRAKDFLLHYLTSNETVHAKLVTEWKKELGVADPMAAIWEAATQYDSRVFLSYQERYRRGTHESGEIYPQWYLNVSIAKSLVVAADSDFESQAIRDLTTRLNLPNVSLYPGFENRGENRGPLQESELDEIIAYAKANGFVNLVICEMGAMSEARFDKVKAAGQRLMHLDHHGRNAKKLSTLEQFGRVLGYELTLDEYVTAIIDRAGIGGLTAMGMTKAELYDHLERTNQLKRVNDVIDRIEPTVRAPEGTGPDRDILLRADLGEGGRMSAVTLPLAYHYFPHTPHILIESPRKIRFVGPWAICEGLRGTLEGKISGAWSWGGDLNAGFVLFTPTDRRDAPAVADRFESTLQTLHPYRCSKRLEMSLGG